MIASSLVLINYYYNNYIKIYLYNLQYLVLSTYHSYAYASLLPNPYRDTQSAYRSFLWLTVFSDGYGSGI